MMTIRAVSRWIIIAFFMAVANDSFASQQVNSLRVGENFSNPIGFHDPSPTFSWKLPVSNDVKFQTAYRIVLTDTPNEDETASPIWDSGKIESDQSAWIQYDGPKLRSRQRLFWRVKFWDDQGRESKWSQQATFEMGLLDQEQWQASWIELDREKVVDSVTIIKAQYGARGDEEAPAVVDVTKRIQRAIKNDAIPYRVKPARLGGDPAPGKPKSLWVEYELNGENQSVEIPENETFNPYPIITAHPGYFLRKEFEVKFSVVKARLYASALGIHQFRINGQLVGEDFLAPGYTAYSKRVETQTYDVTSLIQPGNNAIGALLGEGWYAGNLLLRKRKEVLGKTPKLIGQLELTFADGSVKTITTDETWKGTDQGPIDAAGLYHGEDYDARKELGNWSSVGYDDQSWRVVTSTKMEAVPLLVPKRLPPVRMMKELPAIKLTEPESGKFVFDFGQNLVGFPKVKLSVLAGEKVTFRFAEMLEQDGRMYTTNYRTARSQATYTAAGDGEIEWSPTALTFFGFRYLEVSGLSKGRDLKKESATAQVLHTDFKSAGHFTSSHEKLNQLQSNIRWGQRGNFVDIPTDCPQRDERLGWTGDAQVFLPTSFFNFDVYSFWSRWLESVRDEQTEDGKIPHTVPATNFGYASPGWADVIVTAPWDVYVRTGDIRVLEDNYDAMKKWVSVYERESEGLIPTLTGFGDWLQPYPKKDNKGDTAQDLIATAYFGRDARILCWTATALGNEQDATRFKKLHADIRVAFSNRYFADEQLPSFADTQTACLMGLAYDLIVPSLRQKTESRLLEKFEEADRHLRTGFLGTPLLASVFDDIGHPEISIELLFKEGYPSWFYSIDQGATTMWERWNSYSHADGFGNAQMNSFNHYAYGAIGQFMYERIAGLAPDPEKPGYKHFFIRPLIGGPLKSASARLETPFGIAKSGWVKRDDNIVVNAVVPPNTTATFSFQPLSKQKLLADHIRVNGQRLNAAGIPFKFNNQESVSATLAPGTYEFQIAISNERKGQ